MIGGTVARLVIAAVALAALGHGALAQEGQAPEGESGRTEAKVVAAVRHMVAAAHPLAAAAGRAILRDGGSAVDAAIAVQLVLNLVEPQSSGIGGGAFLLYWSAADASLNSYDGREVAPKAAGPERFLDDQGRPLDFQTAVIGGRSVGVPGTVALMELAHRAHGRLAWARLFAPAIALAESGFPVSSRLNRLLDRELALRQMAPAGRYFYDAAGTPKAVGTTLRNEPFADTLRLIAAEGARAFYQGPIARDIVAAVTSAARNPGDMTEADLAAYRAVARPPVCAPYRAYRVCGMGPPSSGGVAVAQMLSFVAPHDLAGLGPNTAMSVHVLAEAGRLAYADRAQYLADGDFVAVPLKGLLDAGYLAQRAASIKLDRSMGKAAAGLPPWREGRLGADETLRSSGTSHISIVDGAGNAAAMTTTIEDAFGSRLMVRGFLLNNQLTDFSFSPHDAGRPVANRLEPGKRPRSSMAPTIVFAPDNKPLLVVGSPGGSAIPNYVVKTIVAVLDWGLDPQAALALPNFGSRNGPTEIERHTALDALRGALVALGHEVRSAEMTSGGQAILLRDGRLFGGADPRREGVVLGD